MADNITLNSGSGGSDLATDDIAGVHHQRVKIQYGTDGSATDVSDTNPLPVDDAGGSLTVDNTNLDNGHSEDFDTGAGTDTTTAFGIAVPASGGAVVVPGDATAGLKVNLGADNDVTVSGTVTANLSATDNAVLDQIDNNTDFGAVKGGGTESGALRVTLANNSTGVLSVDDNGGSLTVDNSDLSTLAAAVSGSEMQVDVVGSLPAGTNAIGKLAANSGVDIGDVDVTSISAGSNLIGDVGISGARTSGGTTLYKNIDVDESEDQVKGSAGQIYWIHAINLGSAPRYLKIYDATAASVTVGTTVPDLTFPIPSQGDSNGAGFTIAIPNGIAFSTAITVAATTGVADNDTGAPGANEVILNLGYA